MKRYVKLNSKSEVIDLFFEIWKDRFDGTEILLDEVKDTTDCYINGKCISDEFGNPNFQFNNGITEIASSVYTEPARKTHAEPVVRAERNVRIEAMDKYCYQYERDIARGVIPSITDAQYKSILTYIQELCDVPRQSGFPLSVIWPDIPVI